MNRLTIIQKAPTSLDDCMSLWEYEVLETGETFASLTDDIASSFACYMQQRQVEDDVLVNLPFDEYTQQLSIPAFDESIPELQPENTPRQNEIENLLIQAYAHVVIDIIMDLVSENCEGCKNFYPSQRDHDCLMLDNDIRVYRYITEALEKVNEENVMKTFTKMTETLEPSLNGLERLRYECKDSRQEILARKKKPEKKEMI